MRLISYQPTNPSLSLQKCCKPREAFLDVANSRGPNGSPVCVLGCMGSCYLNTMDCSKIEYGLWVKVMLKASSAFLKRFQAKTLASQRSSNNPVVFARLGPRSPPILLAWSCPILDVSQMLGQCDSPLGPSRTSSLVLRSVSPGVKMAVQVQEHSWKPK